MGYPIARNQTAQPLVFLMVLSSDHVTGATGLSPTVTLSKNGAAFAAPAGAVAEIGSGWYKVAGNATDAGTLGPLILHATVATADPSDDRFDVVAYDPLAAAGLGLTNLDAAVTSRLAPTVAGRTAAVNADGTVQADVRELQGAVVNAYDGILTACTSTTGTLPNTESAVTNIHQYKRIYLSGGTGAGQQRTIASSAGLVVTWDRPLLTTGDATTQYQWLAGADVPVQPAWSVTPPTAAAIAAATRDVDNSAPAGGSLGAVLNSRGTSVYAGGAVASVAAPVTITSNVKKNQALAAFGFVMTDSTNHQPDAGLTVTATRSLDGGAFGACVNSPVGIASGAYKINLAAADLNADVVILRFTATGADDRLVTVVTQP